MTFKHCNLVEHKSVTFPASRKWRSPWGHNTYVGAAKLKWMWGAIFIFTLIYTNFRNGFRNNLIISIINLPYISAASVVHFSVLKVVANLRVGQNSGPQPYLPLYKWHCKKFRPTLTFPCKTCAYLGQWRSWGSKCNFGCPMTFTSAPVKKCWLTSS